MSMNIGPRFYRRNFKIPSKKNLEFKPQTLKTEPQKKSGIAGRMNVLPNANTQLNSLKQLVDTNINNPDIPNF